MNRRRAPTHPAPRAVHRRIRRIAMCLAVAMATPWATASVAQDVELQVQPPQPGFGYTVGDQLRQRVYVRDPLDAILGAPVGAAQPSEPAGTPSLPALGRATRWLQRISVTPILGEGGRGGLELVYQVVNAPDRVRRIELPALAVTLRDGGPASAPATPVTIGPLLPRDGSAAPLADRQPPPLSVRAAERVRDLALGTLSVCLLGGAMWWWLRGRREARRLPFARAWHAVRHAAPDDARTWSQVHRAINDAAGGTVHADNLEQLFTARPWLVPHTTALQAFFGASDQRFFERAGQPRAFDAAALAHTLMRAERFASR